MTNKGPYLDCCEKPGLETLKIYTTTQTEMVAIRRCRNCNCNWFYRLKEYSSECNRFADDGDTGAYDRCIWYVRLTDEETETLLQATATPTPDQFADRPGFLMDADGMNKIHGIPYFLRE